MGGWFYNGGDGKFLKSFQIVGRVLTRLFYEDCLYCLPLFLILSNPSPHFPVTSNPNPTVLSVMANMDLHQSSLDTLVPEGSWCMFYATKHQVYWALTHVVFLLVFWFDITHTNTTHSGASRLTRQYNYILTPPVMCSQQLPLLH